MPRKPDSYAVWSGHVHTPEEIKARYGVDEVLYTEDLALELMEADLNGTCMS
eukprot:jgi/Botrbrau1/10693/Bobra.139_2s0023.1